MKRLLPFFLILAFSSVTTTPLFAAPQKSTGHHSAVQPFKISDEFEVSDKLVDKLHARNLSDKDIRTVLALAKYMPGGVNDGNVNKIVDLRVKKKMDWPKISKELKIKASDRPARKVPADDERPAGAK